jgi:glycosyltransferase involved in cell wall biosynthesis
LVGDADHETHYSKSLKEQAKEADVVLTGFIRGKKLNEIFSHAQFFAMPSYHEGLPIALLEAMSYNLNVLVSDIPANLEVGLQSKNYFKVGNIADLATQLESKLQNKEQKKDYSEKIKTIYNWDLIATQIIEVYKS